jgi:hypothetical protein
MSICSWPGAELAQVLLPCDVRKAVASAEPEMDAVTDWPCSAPSGGSAQFRLDLATRLCLRHGGPGRREGPREASCKYGMAATRGDADGREHASAGGGWVPEAAPRRTAWEGAVNIRIPC